MPRQPLKNLIAQTLDGNSSPEGFKQVWPKLQHIAGATKERALLFCQNKVKALQRDLQNGCDKPLQTITEMLNYNSLVIGMTNRVKKEQKDAFVMALSYPISNKDIMPSLLMMNTTRVVEFTLEEKYITDNEARMLYLRAYRELEKSGENKDVRGAFYQRKLAS